jgi:NADH:ubiquinone oxidoreductase subunit F (NADH-binding)
MRLKSYFFSLLLFTALFFSFQSCKKCMNCTSQDKNSGQTIDIYKESCGKKASLDAIELNYRANLPDSLTLDCPRD